MLNLCKKISAIYTTTFGNTECQSQTGKMLCLFVRLFICF